MKLLRLCKSFAVLFFTVLWLFLEGCGLNGGIAFRCYSKPIEPSPAFHIQFQARPDSLDTITEAVIFCKNLGVPVKINGLTVSEIKAGNQIHITDFGDNMQISIVTDSENPSFYLDVDHARVTVPCPLKTVNDLGYTVVIEAHHGF